MPRGVLQPQFCRVSEFAARASPKLSRARRRYAVSRNIALSAIASARAVGYEHGVANQHPGEELVDAPECAEHGGHEAEPPKSRYSAETLEDAANLFRALGDVARLRTLELLVTRELCVSEIAAASGELISTVSHRMRLLRSEGLVSRRRDGRHIYYALKDRHVYDLVLNAFEHVNDEHD